MLFDVTIITNDKWAQLVAFVKQGLAFLDGIVLFDLDFGTSYVHLTMLGFDIALLVFFLVWDAVGIFPLSSDAISMPIYSGLDDDEGELVDGVDFHYSSDEEKESFEAWKNDNDIDDDDIPY